jgi:hypothetical protein
MRSDLHFVERSQRPLDQCVPLKGGGIIIRSVSCGTIWGTTWFPSARPNNDDDDEDEDEHERHEPAVIREPDE